MLPRISRRSRRLLIVCVVMCVPLLVLLSWFAARFWDCVEEERVVAALERQGAAFGIERPRTVLEMARASLHGPRELRMLVYRTSVDLELARRLPGLYAVDFQSTVISEDDARAIGELTHLRILSMEWVRAPRSICGHLARLKRLEWLLLDDVEVKDEGVAEIGKISSLRRLYMSNCGVTDTGLENLRGLAELEVLGLRGSRITGVGLRELADLPKLTTLDLRNCGLTDECLHALTLSSTLSDVDLSDNPITDKGLESISGMKNLRSVGLNRTQITDGGLRWFHARTEPLLLHVKGTAVTKTGVMWLDTLSGLTITEDE